MADITYTPNGAPRAPGYYDPNNPYDTGYSGQRNAELNGGQKDTFANWNYDTGTPMSGSADNWAPPSGGGGGGGGGGDLTASPYYQQYKAQIEAAQAADLSNTKGQLQQLLIAFGLVPEGFQDKYGALDDTIKQLIQKNTDTGVSQYARLLEGKQDAQRSALQNLAARGLSRSGSKGYALRRGSLDFNRSLSDALGAVLGNANQLQGGYASRQMDRQGGLAQLLAQLAANFRPSYSGGGGGYVPAAPQIQQQAQAAPTYSAPAYQNQQYNVGQVQPSGYSVNTGGGFYTNQQGGDLTAKWQRLAGMS